MCIVYLLENKITTTTHVRQGPVDDLATQGARASANMILIGLNRDDSVPAR